MDALTAIAARHSTRSFADKLIPRELLEKIVDAARLAPSALNYQPWEFIVVTDRERLRALAEVASSNGKYLAEASACIAVFCKDTRYYLEDGCAASATALIAAASLGVQSCWVAGDKKSYCEAVSKLLAVPENFRLVSLLALGFSKGPHEPSPKRPATEVLHWEKY